MEIGIQVTTLIKFGKTVFSYYVPIAPVDQTKKSLAHARLFFVFVLQF
jgi:hypothetical protein